jgi:amino acid transporter
MPISIIITLLVVTVLYCASSSVIALMVPYYLLDPITPIPQAFSFVKMHWAKYLVSIGAITSLATCLYASMFPLPRIIYGKS